MSSVARDSRALVNTTNDAGSIDVVIQRHSAISGVSVVTVIDSPQSHGTGAFILTIHESVTSASNRSGIASLKPTGVSRAIDVVPVKSTGGGGAETEVAWKPVNIIQNDSRVVVLGPTARPTLGNGDPDHRAPSPWIFVSSVRSSSASG